MHLSVGGSKCIICPKRPTRFFLKSCLESTPKDHLERLEQEARDFKEPEKKTVELGEACLFSDYVTGLEVRY